MKRRDVLLNTARAAVAVSAGSRLTGAVKLRLNARTRTEKSGIQTQPLDWPAAETAVIICDMWDDHYCRSSARRVGEMIPRMNQTVAAARALGVRIIHAPSSTMEFYAGTPQRQRMIAAPSATPPVPIATWCYLDPKSEAALPIEDEEPCDDEVPRERKRMYSRQHPSLVIDEEDCISDSGQEIYNFCEHEGISRIIMMGVHTNKCVLGRPFGIRQMVRLGRKIVLVRDLTDAMYDPRDEPFVSHARGTEMVIEHIERYWCPTILSRDLIGAS